MGEFGSGNVYISSEIDVGEDIYIKVCTSFDYINKQNAIDIIKHLSKVFDVDLKELD